MHALRYAPYAKHPPMKVLLMTLQDEPPSVETYPVQDGVASEWVRKNKAFKTFITKCLIRQPDKRPTAEQMSKFDFFKKAKGAKKAIDDIIEALPILIETIGSAGDVDVPARDAGAGVATATEKGNGEGGEEKGVSGIGEWDFGESVVRCKEEASPPERNAWTLRCVARCVPFVKCSICGQCRVFCSNWDGGG